MKKSNLVALITDFGLKDSYAGQVKAVMKNINPALEFIDITHQIKPQSVKEAAFQLLVSYKYFPEGTMFLCVVDPGVGTSRKILLVETSEYLFIAPDNGLVSWAATENGINRIYSIDRNEYFLDNASATFQARDIIAPVAASLAKQYRPQEYGTQIREFVRLEFPCPKIIGARVIAQIISYDRFGNAITNITGQYMKRNGLKRVFAGKTQVPLAINYRAGNRNEFVALIGSSGYLEIAVMDGNAEKKIVKRKTVFTIR